MGDDLYHCKTLEPKDEKQQSNMHGRKKKNGVIFPLMDFVDDLKSE